MNTRDSFLNRTPARDRMNFCLTCLFSDFRTRNGRKASDLLRRDNEDLYERPSSR